jgi:hypothetical protein
VIRKKPHLWMLSSTYEENSTLEEPGILRSQAGCIATIPL